MTADPEFSDEAREAWSAVLDDGTRYMRNYSPRVVTKSAVAAPAVAAQA